MKDIVLLASSSGQPIKLKQALAVARKHIGAEERAEAHPISPLLAIVEIHRPDPISSASRVERDGPRVAAYSGYVRPGQRLLPLIRDGRYLTMTDSPGGMAAYFYAHSERGIAAAWSGIHNMERVYYTAGLELSALSNSALLSHCIARNQIAPGMNPGWLPEVMIGTGSLSEKTQFVGTRVVPSRTLMWMELGADARLAPFPLPIRQHDYERGDSVAYDELTQELLQSVEPLRSRSKVLLRLSGGKDSRLVAAMLATARLPAEAVTYGRREGGEGNVALRVADICGIPARAVRQTRASKEVLIENAISRLNRSDGSMVAAQQLCTNDDEELSGVALVEGQAHHLRGGYSRPVRAPYDRVWRMFVQYYAKDIELAYEQARGAKFVALQEIFNRYWSECGAEKTLYWTYIDFRMPAAVQPSYRIRRTPVVWPLMDEKLLLAVSRLHIRDLTSEVAFFEALRRIAPTALQALPLHDNHWRFDVGGAEKTPFPELFADRQQQPSTQDVRNYKIHEDLSVAVELANSLLERGVMIDLREFTPVAAFHRRPLSLDEIRGSEFRPYALRYLWRAIAASLSLSGLPWTYAITETADTLLSGRRDAVVSSGPPTAQ